MIRNYLLIASRNLSKHAGYSAINIIGLAIGLACCLMVMRYVQFELSYEDFHANKTSLYRYIPRGSRDGVVKMQTLVPAGFGPLIADAFPEVEMFSRYSTFEDRPLFKRDDRVMEARPLAIVDPDFFKMFSFKLNQGTRDEVLARPFTIAISQSLADAFFPDGDALGATIRYDNSYDLEITGVFRDVPANSHLQFSYVTTFTTVAKVVQDRYDYPADKFLSNLDAWNYSTYFYIPHVENATSLEARIDQKFTEARGEEFKADGLHDWLQPLTSIHFTEGIKWDSANGNMGSVYIFSSVAVLILLVACFNFMNLSTARAIKRAKEVGLRKVMGAFRQQLISQFMSETLMLVGCALILAILLLEGFVPLFNSLMGLHLSFTYFGAQGILWQLMAAGGVTALLAGSYPAFYLSSFLPARVLKGQAGASGNMMLRKILTVFQFGIATFLMIGMMVVYAQMKFVRNTNLGFEKEGIIYSAPPQDLWTRREVLKENLLSHPEIQSVTFSNGTPGMENATWNYSFPGTDLPSRSMNTMIVDYDFLKTFGLEIIEGRGLSRDYPSDSITAYLVNEAAARDLMLEHPVGTPIQATDGHPVGQIVGVVKDFHFRSLHRKIEPLILRFDPRNMWCMSVRFSTPRVTTAMGVIEDEWKKLSPDFPFTYEFLDDTVAQQYKAEENAGTFLASFASLAIFIACMGLLGLMTFMTEQRKKEIGIRKVLGASVSGVVMLLSRDFSRLVLLGFMMAAPLAWYVMRSWLSNFAYQVDLNPFLFVVAGVLLIGVAWLSVLYQSVRAAITNPVNTLRSE